MANIKITALPANTGVQANSDVLPLVSSGVTTQVTPTALVNASLTAPGVIGSVSPNAGIFTQVSATIGPITVNNGSGTSSFIVNGVSGQSRELNIKTANVTRWSIGAYNTESGSSTGSDYEIKRFDDSGAYVDAPFIINRSTGYITQNSTSVSGNLNVTGSTTLASSLSGVLKSTSGLISAAISGADYAPATSGTNILAGNGFGGFNQVTIGTGLTYSGGTLYYSGSSSTGTVTSVSVTSANGIAGTVATATTTPAITLSTTVTGVLKGNGTAFSAAVAGTDYAAPTSGSSILYGNGAGGFSNVTVGSGLSFSSGTLSSTSAGGSVTTVSVVSANGLAGTVANASSTPAITLTTSITGLLKGNGTAISAATSGTDYAPATSGSSLLYGNSAGGFSNVTIGSNLTFSAGTLNANATVSSVGLSLPSIFTVTNSPVVSTGTLTATLATQTANTVFAGPTTGTAAAPTFRALVAGDIPALSYAPATSGTSILYGNGSGGFSNVTVGTGLSFSAGTLSSTASGGTVTSVSVVSANGFAGTVATATSTPAITLTTSITGLLKGNGTAISAATSGTDYSAGTSALATGIVKSTTSTGALSIAVSGTDYAPATSGSAILKGNGSGGFSSSTAGTDYSAGTSALTTGLVKSTTTTGALSIAVAGTDYVSPGGALGTPSSGTLTNCSGLPISTGVSGLATGIATFLGNPTSANLASAVTDETGSGSLVFNTSPTLTTPTINTAASVGGTWTAAATWTLPAFTLGGTISGNPTWNATTETYNNSVVISAASTKTLTLNGGAGSNGLVLTSANAVGIGTASPLGNLSISATNPLFAITNSNSVSYSIASFASDNTLRIAKYGVADFAVFDSSGNLGLGVTPSASASRAFDIGAWSEICSYSQDGSTILTCNAYNSTGSTWNYKGALASARYDVSQGVFRWYNAPSGTAGNTISFTQAMTLDASGNLLVGTTSSSQISGAGVKILIGSPGNPVSVVAPNSVGGNQGFLMYSTGASAYRFYVDWDGKIYATTTTITGISDQRLKENIRDLDDGLATILALKPRKFDWKEGKGKDIKNDRGFIAQEFEQVLPDLIDQWKDEPPEGEEPYKAVRPDLIPILVKAIQELSAELNELKQRIK